MAATDKITVYRAEAVTLNFTVRQSDDPNADVEDISGWTLSFTVSTDYNVSPPKTLTQSGTVTDGPTGKASVSLSTAELNIEIGSYRYDLWRTDSGEERPLAVGVFQVLGSARIPA